MNILAIIESTIARALERFIFRATITNLSGNKARIQRPGQAVADTQFYPHLSAYTPVVSDEVLCLSFGGSVIILDKIIR